MLGADDQRDIGVVPKGKAMYQDNPHRSLGDKDPKDAVIVHKQCALNPLGMTKSGCQAMTSVVARNHQGCCGVPWREIAPCTSPDRVCRVCVTQPGKKNPVINATTGLCEFHTKHGVDAVQGFAGYERALPTVVLPVRTAYVAKHNQRHKEPVRHKDVDVESKTEKHAKVKEKLTPNVALMLDHSDISYVQARRLAKYADNPTRQEALADQLKNNKISIRDL